MFGYPLQCLQALSPRLALALNYRVLRHACCGEPLSQIENDIANRPRAANENVARRRILQWVWLVGDRP